MKASSHFLRRSVTFNHGDTCMHTRNTQLRETAAAGNLSVLFVHSLSTCPHTLNKTPAGGCVAVGELGSCVPAPRPASYKAGQRSAF